MKKSILSPPSKSKNKSLQKSASGGLVDFLNSKFPKRIPIAAITAATKFYGRGKPLLKDDKLVKRLAGNGSDVETASLVTLLAGQEYHEKGKPLSEEGVRRVYQTFANAEGKLTFEYIMKMGESTGVQVNEKMAKRIVRKYGKKDSLTADDCLKINNRRASKSLSKSPQK